MDMSAESNMVSSRPSPRGARRAGKILVADDERNLRRGLCSLLGDAGHVVVEAHDANRACELVGVDAFDVVVTDLEMGSTSGMDVLRRVKEISPQTQVILMSGHRTLENREEAARLGAHDFIQKPFTQAALQAALEDALAKAWAATRVVPPAPPVRNGFKLDDVVGCSLPLRELLDRMLRAAPTDAAVLITGESGTGKELIAKGIHANSRRSHKPFVTVNCAAVSEALLESELFGHVRGAFTGAFSTRRGLFEEADEGSLFLDEIGESSPSFQAKLLRAIQDGQIMRLGTSQPVRVDVRIIAATNQNLRAAAAAKRFRSDLYYRLNVVRLALPPLRERREDIPLLVEHFLDRFNRKMSRRVRLGDGVLESLRDYRFNGNVRELQNMIEHGVALADDGILHLKDIRVEQPVAVREEIPRTFAQQVRNCEIQAIGSALRAADGNLERSAALLDLNVKTLSRMIKRLRLGARGEVA
jgi:two-component system, NtrC family, response regulator HydG